MPASLSTDSKAAAVGAAALGAVAGAAAVFALLANRKQNQPKSKEGVPFKAYQEGTGDHASFHFERLSNDEMLQRADEYATFMNDRRTMRFYSPDVPPIEVVKKCILAAGTAPSGAHLQPWFFAIVQDPSLKQQIREAVEAEEQKNYDGRMKDSWVADVKDLVKNVHDGSTVKKPYLTEAPYIVVMFKQTSSVKEDGTQQAHYYVTESAGIAAGMFLTALHNANLSTLTSTPMGAEGKIRQLLGRPDTEKVFLLLPVGWPAKDATVPNRPNNGRKAFDKVGKVY